MKKEKKRKEKEQTNNYDTEQPRDSVREVQQQMQLTIISSTSESCARHTAVAKPFTFNAVTSEYHKYEYHHSINGKKGKPFNPLLQNPEFLNLLSDQLLSNQKGKN